MPGALERVMNCPFYEEKYFRYCKAMAKRIMVPSRTEKEEFCCEHYRECPYFKDHKVKGEWAGTCKAGTTTETPNEK